MQTNRQKQIVGLLLENGTMTARALASHFSVSTRTIYRDIVNLTSAGIPLSMTQGRDGGITLDPSYRPEGEPTGSTGALSAETAMADWLSLNGIDLLAEIKEAILNHVTVRFHYTDSGNQMTPCAVDPLKLICHYKIWYLFGYDRVKEQYTYYRISRIFDLTVSVNKYQRDCPAELPPIHSDAKTVHVKLLFRRDAAWRIYEDFKPDSIQSGSRLLVEATFLDDDDLLSMLLAYGSDCEVLEPESLRTKVRRELAKTQRHYIN